MRTLAAIFCCTCVIAAGASPTYSVQVIPPPAGWTVGFMTGINTSGAVAGNGLTSQGVIQAFVGTPLGSTPVPLPAGVSGITATAINDLGQVAGYAYTLNGFGLQAFVGTTAGVSLIPLLPSWTQSEAFAANNKGQVAGEGGSQSIGAFNPFVGTTSGSTPIPLPPGWNTGFLTAINASGQVAGYVGGSSSGRAFWGTSSGITLMTQPPGWPYSVAQCINQAGQVAGDLMDINGYSGASFFWAAPSGAVTVLPPGSVSDQCMNDAGVVVGLDNTGGWIWDSMNGKRLLDPLVPTGWNIVGANSIRNNGLILALGSFDGGPVQYVELTPIIPATPAPAVWILVITGLASLPLLRKFAAPACARQSSETGIASSSGGTPR